MNASLRDSQDEQKRVVAEANKKSQTEIRSQIVALESVANVAKLAGFREVATKAASTINELMQVLKTSGDHLAIARAQGAVGALDGLVNYFIDAAKKAASLKKQTTGE
jgi:hypothetical protein